MIGTSYFYFSEERIENPDVKQVNASESEVANISINVTYWYKRTQYEYSDTRCAAAGVEGTPWPGKKAKQLYYNS